MKRIRHWLEYIFYRFLMAVIPLLPRKAVVGLARFFGRVGPKLIFWEAEKARVNLDLVYGDSLSRQEKEKILRESFENVAQTSLYFFWSRRLTSDQLRQLVEVPGESLKVASEVTGAGKGAIALLAHYGNWELMGVASGFLNIPRLNVIVRPLKNPLLNEPVNGYRTHSGNRVIERKNAIIKSLRALQRGEVVVLVFDQNADPREGGIFVPFFGLPASTTKAAAILSLRTGAPIVPVTCEPLPEGRYRLRFDPPVEFDPSGDQEQDVERLTAKCNESLEEIIRRRPGPWLWMYKRWRIRPTVEQGPYPAYSKPAKDLR